MNDIEAKCLDKVNVLYFFCFNFDCYILNCINKFLQNQKSIMSELLSISESELELQLTSVKSSVMNIFIVPSLNLYLHSSKKCLKIIVFTIF